MSRAVMVIDDCPVVRTVLRIALEDGGFHVAEAADGEDALEQLDGRPFAALVCDLSMPRVDGLSLLRWLRHHPRYRQTPVVVITLDQRPETRERARSLGAQAFMQKPCSPQALMSTLQRLCH
ncbi:MAG: response regulator [Rubrivivax sp.]|nr:response regulator [Rubrivivax sp.]